MRSLPKRFIVGGAGLCAIALSGVLLAQGQNSDQQNQRGAGGREAGREGHSGGHDAQMLIAHGLAMAIEGSTLQGIAMQSGGSMGAIGSSGGGELGTGTSRGS